MEQQSRAKLEAKGWQVGTATDFLDLTAADLLVIEIKLALSRRLAERKQYSSASQETAATPPSPNLQAESSTSIDRLIHDMIATGASPQEIGQLIASIDIAVA